MAEGLPEGLITNNDNVANEIERLHEVDVQDIIRMWKVYSASKNILPDGTGQRLANFLWRVWGSEEIVYNLTGSQFAAYFSAISEDGPLRTTPTQSPRASRNFSTAIRASKAPSRNLAPPSNVREDLSATPRPTAPPQHTQKRDARPPSILKRPQNETPSGDAETFGILPQSTITEDNEDESTPSTTPSGKTSRSKAKDHPARSMGQSKMTRPPTNRADSETLPPHSAMSSTMLQGASSEDTIKPPLEATPKGKRTKTVFHASARKRPVTVKRKSSQSSSNNTSSTISLRPSAPASDSPGTPGPLSKQPTATREASEAMGPAQDPKPPPPDPQSQRSRQSSLVDPDFRSKFVEKTRSAQSSFVNLPSLLRKPSPASATPATHQAAGTMDNAHAAQPAGRGRGKVTFTEGSKPPGPTGPEVFEEGEGGGPALPRTRSQLTLLLERDRRGGGKAEGRKRP